MRNNFLTSTHYSYPSQALTFPELMQQPSQPCKVFAVILTAHIVRGHSSLPQSLKVAQQVCIESHLMAGAAIGVLHLRDVAKIESDELAEHNLVSDQALACSELCIACTKQSSRVRQVLTRRVEPAGVVCGSLSTTDPSRVYH